MKKQTGRASSGALPVLLRRINERRVIDALARGGPMSRADLSRFTGISRPTVSKAVESLASRGLVEQRDRHDNKTGRPAPLYALADDSVRVVGVSVRPDVCRMVVTGVDCRGEHRGDLRWPTPDTVDALIDAIAERARSVDGETQRRLLGLGVCVPGIVEPRTGRVAACPIIPSLEGAELAARLARKCRCPVRVVAQPTGLCLAERWFDHTADHEHFVVIDTTDALVAQLHTRGRAVLSPRGYGGAIGRLPVHPDDHDGDGDGRPLRLDQVATDAAFAHAVSRRTRRSLEPSAAVAVVRDGGHSQLVDSLVRHLATTVVAAAHLFDPDAIFLHGVQLDAADDLIDRVADVAAQRGDRRPLHRGSAALIHAPLAAIVDHLTHADHAHG